MISHIFFSIIYLFASEINLFSKSFKEPTWTNSPGAQSLIFFFLLPTYWLIKSYFFPIHSCDSNRSNLDLKTPSFFFLLLFPVWPFLLYLDNMIPLLLPKWILTWHSNFNIPKLSLSLANWVFPCYFWGVLLCKLLIHQILASWSQSDHLNRSAKYNPHAI